MKPERFKKLVESRLNGCLDVLTAKGTEYSRNGDRLWNFKQAAAMTGNTAEQALVGMMLKHWVSILDMMGDPDNVTPHMISEKLGDGINYCLLAEGLLTERMENNQINPHIQSNTP